MVETRLERIVTQETNLSWIPFTLLFASGTNGLLGRNNTLPWDCPEDLEHFKSLTSQPDTALVMGYNTWDSLPVGKISREKLSGRKKIVLTRKKGLTPQKDTIFTSFTNRVELLRMLRPQGFKRVYVIGGAQVINSFLHLCDEAIITWMFIPSVLQPKDVAWRTEDLKHYYDTRPYRSKLLTTKAEVMYYRSLSSGDMRQA